MMQDNTTKTHRGHKRKRGWVGHRETDTQTDGPTEIPCPTYIKTDRRTDNKTATDRQRKTNTRQPGNQSLHFFQRRRPFQDSLVPFLLQLPRPPARAALSVMKALPIYARHLCPQPPPQPCLDALAHADHAQHQQTWKQMKPKVHVAIVHSRMTEPAQKLHGQGRMRNGVGLTLCTHPNTTCTSCNAPRHLRICVVVLVRGSSLGDCATQHYTVLLYLA